MSLFSGSSNKAKQIELQNLLFGTNEKKLMVSDEFLDNMKKQYISKRMKNINQRMEIIFTTKSPKNFFNSYDSIMESLGELIKLQKYHEFKKPVPSEFKTTVEGKKDRYIMAMINRAWKHANNKANFDPTLGEKRDPAKFAPTLNEMLEFTDRYSDGIIGHIDRFYTSVYGYGINETPKPEEPAEEAVTEEAVTEEVPEEALTGEIPKSETEDMKLKEEQ